MAKTYTREVTERFLELTEDIIADRRLTQNEFALSVHITSSNLIRMKNSEENNVSLENLGAMINLYNASPIFLLLGKGERFSNLELAASTNTIIARLPQMEESVEAIRKELRVLKNGIKKR